MNDLKEYVEKNREKLHRLAKNGDSVVRAMALAILKKSGENFEEVQNDE